MTFHINLLSEESKVVPLNERQIGIVLAAIRHSQDNSSNINWDTWIEDYPNPQDDELDELCELLNDNVYVVVEEYHQDKVY